VARRAVFERYRAGLAHIGAIGWMPEASYGTCTRWLSVCTLDPRRSPVGPAELIGALARSGIEARHVWKPMHLQPLFRDAAYFPLREDRSFADEAFATGVCLPSGSNLIPEQQEEIIRVIDEIFAYAGRRSTARRA
jgi:pyridoxal phosphate-dependent aminotransferase EpsN